MFASYMPRPKMLPLRGGYYVAQSLIHLISKREYVLDPIHGHNRAVPNEDT